MKKERQVELNTYIVPPNFARKGTILGGMLKMRNAIEALLFAGPILYLIAQISMSVQYKFILMIFVGGPIAGISLLGVNDGPLSVFLKDFLFHFFQKHSLKYYTFNVERSNNTSLEENLNQTSTKSKKKRKLKK